MNRTTSAAKLRIRIVCNLLCSNQPLTLVRRTINKAGESYALTQHLVSHRIRNEVLYNETQRGQLFHHRRKIILYYVKLT